MLTYSFKNNYQRRCILTFPAKSEIQTVFFILPDETKIWKKSTIQKMLRTLILHTLRKIRFGKINYTYSVEHNISSHQTIFISIKYGVVYFVKVT